MITVRFPSGFSVQYNSATFCSSLSTGNISRLYTEEDGELICRVPADCIVEFVSPCRTYNASGPTSELEAEVRALRKEIASLKRKVGKS